MRVWQRFAILIALISIGMFQLDGRHAIGVSTSSQALDPRHRANTYYVSHSGSNQDGRSWDTAWSELNQIVWPEIQPGDTILLDGGTQEMIYSSTLSIGASGAAGAPISVRLADTPGRNGRVVIFGGRRTPLPYCGQMDYVPWTSDARSTGIDVGDRSWVIIDGTKWSGISIYGHREYGVQLTRNSSDVTVRGLEISDNGWIWRQADGSWAPDGKGVDLAGSNLTFEQMIVHDNGQDAFQSRGGDSGGYIENLTVRRSWLYISRRSPITGDSFNYCAHPDGIQIWNGSRQQGVLIEDSVIGSGFMQGVNLGEPMEIVEGVENWATFDNVTIRNTLFYRNLNANIMSGFRPQKSAFPRNWRIENVTSYEDLSLDCDLANQGDNVHLRGFSGHIMTNSIIYGGCTIYIPDSTEIASKGISNCVFGIRAGIGKLNAQVASPLFVAPERGDFSLAAGSPCAGKGSSISSGIALLGIAH